MSLRARLDAVRLAALKGGLGFARCELCRGPDENAIGVVVLAPDEELSLCTGCGGAVDPTGRTLVQALPFGSSLLVELVCDPTDYHEIERLKEARNGVAGP